MQRPGFPVLRSKIRVPPLPEVFIARPHLEDQALAYPEAPARRLIYLSAPPGYGKTTVLCRIAQRFAGKTAWVSLDRTDNDRDRLADHLAAALFRARTSGRTAGDADLSGPDRLAQVLYGVESQEEPILLVLDDAHTLHDEGVFDTLRAFLAYQPENCRIVIASREDLPLPMSAHRQTDRLLELRAAELRANDSEARAMLTRLGVDLDPPALAGVLRKTAGWWSCLKLFAISWRQRRPEERLRFLEHFRGTDRFIAEFLLESLVSALPSELSDSAAVMAVPDFFNEALYTLLTGRDDCPRFIERLQRMNVLSLRPDEGAARYRYHPLLRDYLRHQLARGRRAELHRMTAQWFTANGFSDRAARHTQFAGRLERAGAGPDAGAAGNAAPGGGPTAGRDAVPGGSAAAQAAPAGVAAEGGVPFSRRERELLQALSQGLSNDEIAARLFISTGTVKWHLNNIYGKLGAKSRTDALSKARAAGLFNG